jgi:hypothetical protein
LQNKYINVIKSILFSLLISCLYSCTSHGADEFVLKDYYNKHTQLHQEIADSLTIFSKRYNTKVILGKAIDGRKLIVFSINIPDSNLNVLISFDSLYKRYDSNPDKTLSYVVPNAILEKFNTSIYSDIAADSTFAFFVYKWNTPFGIGTRADSQYGIYISKDSIEINKFDKKISNNACITSGSVF